MTQCIDITKSEPTEGSVQFTYWLDTFDRRPTVISPSDFTKVVLVARQYTGGMDLMVALRGEGSRSQLFLGYWNGGFV